MTGQPRYSTRAVTALEMPALMAETTGCPVLVVRSRRGARRLFERAIAPLGERAIQILDADGYLLLIVKDDQEQGRIIEDLRLGPPEVEISAWDKAGNKIAIDKGIQ